MSKYLLLLKRLIKKKSYILMLLVVPALVLLLNAMSTQESGLLTIGVYLPGQDYASTTIRADLENNPGELHFIFYDDATDAENDVISQKLTEAWIFPENMDDCISEMAAKNSSQSKIGVVILEDGLTHMLAKEVLASRIYPLVARQIAVDYITENVYQKSDTDTSSENTHDTDGDFTLSDNTDTTDTTDTSRDLTDHTTSIYDNYNINGNLFELGYVDGTAGTKSTADSYLLMPLRGILSLWLLLCGIAASMYYLEDEKNGLFIWWKTKTPMLRDFGYYVINILIPSAVVLIGLKFGGVFTNFWSEILALALYDVLLILLSIVFREIIKSIQGLGVITPILILSSAIFSPVFIDFKEGRELQIFFPSFHYLSSIHDAYYLKSMALYIIILLVFWTIIRMIKKMEIRK